MNVFNLPCMRIRIKRALFFRLLLRKKRPFLFMALSKYSSMCYLVNAKHHEAMCRCVKKKLAKQRHEKRVTVCKSTFHHFYNAYIRLWVLGFYASLLSFALFMSLLMCFLWQVYRGKCFYFVWCENVPCKRFLSHLTR